MTWIKLVERESDFWKNYMMLESLLEFKSVFGFPMVRRLTTRRGFTFTHWLHEDSLIEFGKMLEEKLLEDGNFTSKILQIFKTSKRELLSLSRKIYKLNKTKLSEPELLLLFKQFCSAYKAIYPPFHISTHTDKIEENINQWLSSLLGNKESQFNKQRTLLLSQKKKERERALKQLEAPEHICRQCYFLSQASWIRLESRITFNASHQLSQSLFDEIGTRRGLAGMDIKWLTSLELAKLIEQEIYPHKTVEHRKNTAVLIYYHDRIDVKQGRVAERVIEKELPAAQTDDNLIKGAVAYPGKVIGRVRIVKNPDDIKEMKKGDILVARMTTPDLLPAVHKAAAIITDEGGLTCHAAIIAREFKIPCIIGTQFATEVLKNGYKVLVDAENGFVKKYQ